MVLLHWGLGWYHHVHSQLDYSIAMITVLYGIAAIHQGLRHLAVLLLLFLLVMALVPPVVFSSGSYFVLRNRGCRRGAGCIGNIDTGDMSSPASCTIETLIVISDTRIVLSTDGSFICTDWASEKSITGREVVIFWNIQRLTMTHILRYDHLESSWCRRLRPSRRWSSKYLSR
jgi:hypothetical protein